MVTVVLAQVMVPVVEADALGMAVLDVTEVLAVVLQPFDGSFTVTVYVPAALTVAAVVFPPETIPGPLQLNDTPEVEELPFTVTVVEAQVIVPVVLADALGGVVFEATEVVTVFVQLLAGSVTTSV
jgi:hypothetical protein